MPQPEQAGPRPPLRGEWRGIAEAQPGTRGVRAVCCLEPPGGQPASWPSQPGSETGEGMRLGDPVPGQQQARRAPGPEARAGGGASPAGSCSRDREESRFRRSGRPGREAEADGAAGQAEEAVRSPEQAPAP